MLVRLRTSNYLLTEVGPRRRALPRLLRLLLDCLLPGSADRDLLRFLLGRLRDPQLEHAILVGRLDRVAVDTLRQGERSGERTVWPLDELRRPR
jgi:hypothetical protein